MQPFAIKTNLINKIISSNNGVAQIEIQIVDEKDKPVFLANNEVTCLIDGPLKLLGLEASNPSDMTDYTDNRQRVFHGRMIAYFQAIGQKGTAKVTLKSPWLLDSIVELKVE